jgi:hypothetical protein
MNMEKLKVKDIKGIDLSDISAIIAKPKQPYIDWANTVFGENEKVTLGEYGKGDDSNVYLIPEIEDDDDLNKFLKKKWKCIFANELYDWCTEESLWPKNVSFEMFLEWFEIEYNSMVIDLSDTIPF